MVRTINCSNPICGEVISVPQGSVQVICPACNTWHFPETDDAAPTYQDPQPQTPYPTYDAPPILGSQEAMPQPPAQPQEPRQDWPAAPNNPPETHAGLDAVNPYAKNIKKQEFAPEETYEQARHEQKGTKVSYENEKIAYLLTETGERMSLKEGRNIIGRKNADLIIDNRTISRRHCVIEASRSETGSWDYALYDVGHIESTPSTNGVYITGRTQRLANYERLRIVHGTTIKIGTVNLTLKND